MIAGAAGVWLLGAGSALVGAVRAAWSP